MKGFNMQENIQKQPMQTELANLSMEEVSIITSFVTSKFDELKQNRSSKETKWLECVKAYLNHHNYQLAEVRKWRSQVYIPLTYEAVTNIYSNLKRSIFPTDSSFFNVEGNNYVAELNANQVKSFLLVELEKMNFISKFGSFLKQLIITGNSAAAVYWKKVIRKSKIDGKLVEKAVYEGAEFETINIFDIVFETTQPNWEEGMVIHRVYRNFEQIKSNPVYSNVDNLVDSATVLQDPNVLESSTAFDMSGECTKFDKNIKLLSAYGDFKVNDKIYYDYLAVVANDSHLIRFEPNPYPVKPFIFSNYENVPNEIYGIGAVEPALGIQYLVNTFSNQKSDVLSLIINGMWAYVDDGIIDPEEIIAKPGALIAMKDPNNIRPLHPDSSVTLSYNEIAQLKAEFQEITGATKYFTGGPTLDFSKTATEVSALQSAATVRFSEVIQNIEQNALKRAIRLIFLYYGIFNTSVRQLKYTENGYTKFIELASMIFEQDYNFTITGANSTVNKEIRINKLVEFIKTVAATPSLSNRINILELVKHLYRELGFKDEQHVFGNFPS